MKMNTKMRAPCGRGSQFAALLIASLLSSVSPFANATYRVTTFASDELTGEDRWANVASLKLNYEYAPGEKTSAPAYTEIRVARDAKNMIIQIKAMDPNPNAIRGPFARRDSVADDQDHVTIFIDPVGTKKFAQFFRINPRGAIEDGLYNDTTNSEDSSPNFPFTVTAWRLGDTGQQGWSAELRIPFSSLRYTSTSSWNVLAVRNYPREQNYKIASAAVPREFSCLICYAEALTGLESLPASMQYLVTPQTTFSRRQQKIDGANAENKNEFVAGVDVKVNVTSDIVIDATFKPDFSQVELDAAQLTSNNQFALFLPEKRPFFLEGADILSDPLQSIYTRTLNSPVWGARITQRTQPRDYTLLTVRDQDKGLLLVPGTYRSSFQSQSASSYATIGRLREHFGPVTLGGLITDRSYDDGSFNRVVGADITWRPTDEDRLVAQLLGAQTKLIASDVGNAPPVGRGSAVFAGWYRNTSNFNGELRYSEVSKDFRADNGFITQSGFRNIIGYGLYQWRDFVGLNAVGFRLYTSYKTDLSGAVLDQRIAPNFFASTARNTSINLEWRSDRTKPNEFGTKFRRQQAFARVESSPFEWMPRIMLMGSFGDRVDITNDRLGKGANLSTALKIRPSARFEFDLQHDQQWINSIDQTTKGQEIFRELSTQLTAVGHVSATDNIRLIVQEGTTRRNPSLFSIPVIAENRSRVASLVYTHRVDLGPTFYLGATAARTAQTGGSTVRNNELFVKLAWAFAN